MTVAVIWLIALAAWIAVAVGAGLIASRWLGNASRTRDAIDARRPGQDKCEEEDQW